MIPTYCKSTDQSTINYKPKTKLSTNNTDDNQQPNVLVVLGRWRKIKAFLSNLEGADTRPRTHIPVLTTDEA